MSAYPPEKGSPADDTQPNQHQQEGHCCHCHSGHALQHHFQHRGRNASVFKNGIKGVVAMASASVNKPAIAMGCESFVPMSLEEECQKAARILETLSYHSAPSTDNSPPPPASQHPITIQPTALSSAVGLLIFTTGRIGFGHVSGSTGSGILITRRSDQDRSWGPPCAIQVGSLGAGMLAWGLDISDRVYVFSTKESLDALTQEGIGKKRFVLGPEVVLAAGPYGGGAGVGFSGAWGKRRRHREAWHRGHTCSRATPVKEEVHEPVDESDAEKEPFIQVESVKKAETESANSTDNSQAKAGPLRGALNNPVSCYMRSYGLYAGLQAEGTVIMQRSDANAAFYGRPVSVGDILGGGGDLMTPRVEKATEGLMKVLKTAEHGNVA